MKDFSKYNCNPLNTKELSSINGGDVLNLRRAGDWILSGALAIGDYLGTPWYLYEK